MSQRQVNVIVCTDRRRCAYLESNGRTGLQLLAELQRAALDLSLEDRVQVTQCQCIFGCTYGPRIDVARRWSGEKVLYGSIEGDACITLRGVVRFAKIPEGSSDLIHENLPPRLKCL